MILYFIAACSPGVVQYYSKKLVFADVDKIHAAFNKIQIPETPQPNSELSQNAWSTQSSWPSLPEDTPIGLESSPSLTVTESNYLLDKSDTHDANKPSLALSGSGNTGSEPTSAPLQHERSTSPLTDLLRPNSNIEVSHLLQNQRFPSGLGLSEFLSTGWSI